MLNASYNLSLRLKEYLKKIEDLRTELLLTPLSPKVKLQLGWEAMVSRIYYSLLLCGKTLERNDVIKFLSQRKKASNKQEQEITKYKQAIDYIRHNWYAATNKMTPKTILILYKIISNAKLRVPIIDLQHLLDYIQANPEHPIIQSGIVNIEIAKMRPFDNSNQEIAQLLTLLILYKYGYSFEGLLVLERQWVEYLDSFKENFQMATRFSTITLWLEYFADSIERELEVILKSIKAPRLSLTSELADPFWEINDRQRGILSLSEEPNFTITNKKVQKAFKVSQITASRDLSKLTSLGFLLPFGKGRSIYYTKI